MSLLDRVRQQQEREALCRGCSRCRYGAEVPCPSRSNAFRAAWMRRAATSTLPAKEYR